MTPPDASSPADAFREFIAETVARGIAYGQHAESYADLRDDAGLHRAVQMMTRCVVKAAETLPMLTEAARQDRAMRDAARANTKTPRAKAIRPKPSPAPR